MPQVREAIADANVLLRYLTDEPQELADRAASILEAADTGRTVLAVTSVTVAEVVYVLGSVYHWDRRAIAERVLKLLSASVLLALEEGAVVQALEWYRDNPALHFADAYIAAVAVERGHGSVVSFDRALRRLSGVTLVDSPAGLNRGY